MKKRDKWKIDYIVHKTNKNGKTKYIRDLIVPGCLV